MAVTNGTYRASASRRSRLPLGPGPPKLRRTTAWLLALALALLLAAGWSAWSPAPDSPLAESAGPPPRPEEQAAALAAELAAAKTHAIYLALDPRGGHLDLKVDGLLLRRFRVERGLFGRPRFSLAGGGRGALPVARFRLITELPEPERPLIPIRSPEGAGAGSSSLAVSEARAESMAQMPTHYRLRFQPPLELSVRGEGGAAPNESALGRLWRVRFRIYEGWQSLGYRATGRAVPPRIVLYLAPEEAQRLFMTLDPAMQLVIAAPPPAPAPKGSAAAPR